MTEAQPLRQLAASRGVRRIPAGPTPIPCRRSPERSPSPRSCDELPQEKASHRAGPSEPSLRTAHWMLRLPPGRSERTPEKFLLPHLQHVHRPDANRCSLEDRPRSLREPDGGFPPSGFQPLLEAAPPGAKLIALPFPKCGRHWTACADLLIA